MRKPKIKRASKIGGPSGTTIDTIIHSKRAIEFEELFGVPPGNMLYHPDPLRDISLRAVKDQSMEDIVDDIVDKVVKQVIAKIYSMTEEETE